MQMFRPKRKMSAPNVWGPTGVPLNPHMGGKIPKGSYILRNGIFEVLPAPKWMISETADSRDDMGVCHPVFVVVPDTQ